VRQASRASARSFASPSWHRSRWTSHRAPRRRRDRPGRPPPPRRGYRPTPEVPTEASPRAWTTTSARVR